MNADSATDKATIRMFLKAMLEGRRRWVLLSLLFPLGNLCIFVLAPLVIGRILSQLALPHGNPATYIPYLALTAIVGIICNRFGSASILCLQAETMQRLESRAFTALLKRSTGYHNNNVGGKLVSDLIDYPTSFAQLSNATITSLLPFGLVLLVGAVVVTIDSWQLGVIVAVMTAYTLWSAYRDVGKRAPIRAKRHKIGKGVTAHAADAIVNVHTVKTFAREQDEINKHDALNDHHTKLRIRDWTSASHAGNLRIAVLFGMQFVFVLALITFIRRDPALLGTGIYSLTFVVLLSNRMFEVNAMLRQIEEGLLQARPITEMLLEEPEIQDKPHANELHVTNGAVNLRDVAFEYHDSTNGQRVFKQLSLDIKPGEKIGLVGPSGGGKSTLTRLLLRFDDIDAGAITIDGQNIADVTQESLRQSIAYVPQEPLMFHRSVHENIAYGKPEATQKQITTAAKQAHAHDFVMGLSDAYDTIVGERGVKLSGGQRQRVAIARAILKDAPILILDEATSALDSESEVLIQDALWKLMEGRTALVIAHRLSTIQKMDRIIVLDAGKIVEEGTHKQLLAGKGLYAKLWKHQSGGFLED
ncbi:MAG TPA: ABC transporter ATP-binding protein [Candidatus Saccharimonadales bacterium]|nr:ABC transporter ATP-binding protein [Candidatus Saccharimonadales bacterium]